MDSKGDEQTDFIISVSKVKHPEVVSFKNNIQKMLGGWYHLDIEWIDETKEDKGWKEGA